MTDQLRKVDTFYTELLKYMKVERTSQQCQDKFCMSRSLMDYHFIQLRNLGQIEFTGNTYNRSKMLIAVKKQYVRVKADSTQSEVNKAIELKKNRAIKISPTTTLYKLTDTEHPFREARKSARQWVSGSSLSAF